MRRKAFTATTLCVAKKDRSRLPPWSKARCNNVHNGDHLIRRTEAIWAPGKAEKGAGKDD
jgi:hypothetical protein